MEDSNKAHKLKTGRITGLVV